MLLAKDKRIEKELAELQVQNARLNKILQLASLYCEVEFKKDTTVTCIYRSPEENTAVGGIPNSPHLNWEAADLRAVTLTPEQREKLVKTLNNITFRNGKNTSLCHAVDGGALHFHIQVAKV